MMSYESKITQLALQLSREMYEAWTDPENHDLPDPDLWSNLILLASGDYDKDPWVVNIDIKNMSSRIYMDMISAELVKRRGL